MRVTSFAGSTSDWNAFVSAQAGQTAFHRAELADVTASVFRHEVLRLAAYTDDGALAAVLPLVRVRSRIFGHFLVSMPFVSYGGPLGSDAGIQALASHAQQLAASSGADLLELRSARPLPLEMPVSQRKITVVLKTVPGDATATFNAFKAKLRSQVRRPAKDGVEVRMGPEQVGPFFEVFAHHMRDLGTPAMPRAWFEGLARAYGDDFWVATAWHNGLSATFPRQLLRRPTASFVGCPLKARRTRADPPARVRSSAEQRARGPLFRRPPRPATGAGSADARRSTPRPSRPAGHPAGGEHDERV